MSLIVQKYGGTSVANIELIKKVAENILRAKAKGDQVVVVLSARAGETNKLVELSKSFGDKVSPDSADSLLAIGEQASISLLAMALESNGIKARTLLGWQVPIITDSAFGRARIKKVHPNNILSSLKNDEVPIIAGFQGVTEEGRITTLGRGGSDTTAAAIAAALNADRCDIYTDVRGVFTCDPKICKDPKLLDKVSYEELLEFADAGAKVMQTRSVEIAAKYKVKMRILSSFGEKGETHVVPEDGSMENVLVSGVTVNNDEAKVAIRNVPDKVGIPAKIFEPLSRSNINVDLIIQNVSEKGFTDLSFTVPKADLRKAVELAERAAKEVGAGKVEAAGNIAKLTVVGLGMRSHAGVAHKVFDTLAKEGVAIQMIGTSEIKLSMVIDMNHSERAVKALREAFEL